MKIRPVVPVQSQEVLFCIAAWAGWNHEGQEQSDHKEAAHIYKKQCIKQILPIILFHGKPFKHDRLHSFGTEEPYLLLFEGLATLLRDQFQMR